MTACPHANRVSSWCATTNLVCLALLVWNQKPFSWHFDWLFQLSSGGERTFPLMTTEAASWWQSTLFMSLKSFRETEGSLHDLKLERILSMFRLNFINAIAAEKNEHRKMVERQLMFLEVTNISFTVLSRTSTHGCSQLKYQKSTVGDYTEGMLEWDCPRASANSGCEISWCSFGIILECEPTFQASSALVPCSTRILCCKRRTLRTRLQTGVFRPWCLKCIRTVAAVYVSSSDLLLIHYTRI